MSSIHKHLEVELNTLTERRRNTIFHEESLGRHARNIHRNTIVQYLVVSKESSLRVPIALEAALSVLGMNSLVVVRVDADGNAAQAGHVEERWMMVCPRIVTCSKAPSSRSAARIVGTTLIDWGACPAY